MKKSAVILAATLMAGIIVPAYAQETNRDANWNIVKGPYLTNSFGDNWFVDLGTGGSIYIGGINSQLSQQLRPEFNVSFGKWFTPEIGGRLAFSCTPRVNEIDGMGRAYNFYLFNIHADVLWDMLTTIDGYKENRIFRLIPYLGTGYAQTGNASSDDTHYISGTGKSFTVNFGFINKFFLNRLLDLNIEVGSALATSELDRLQIGSSALDAPFYTSIGFTFNLGKKKTFQRASTYTAEKVDLAVAKTIATKDSEIAVKDDEIAAAADENEKLKREIEDLKAQLAAIPDPKDTVIINYVGEFPPEVVVFFERGKSVLNGKENSHFQTFAHYVKQCIKAGRKVTLIGSADKQTGTFEKNMRIAKERAELVKKMLVKDYGIPASELETVSEGGTNNRFDIQDMNRCVYVRF